MAQNAGRRGLVPGEVLELLDERDKVQSWVEKLADLESEASPAVYEKVVSDYRERLAGLSERLAAHRDTVQGSLDDVRDRLARLAQERAERVAALEEAKLRFTVGEYAEKEWERHRETDGQAVAELEESLGSENEARQELERILSELPGASDRGRGEPAWAAASRGGAIPPRSPDSKEEAKSPAAAVATPPAAYVVEPGEEELAGEPGDEVKVEEGEETDVPDVAAEPLPEPAPATDELAARSTESPGTHGSSIGGADTAKEGDVAGEPPPGDESFLDELAFLESLTLDDAERFDAVSAMLEEGEEDENGEDEEERPH